MIDPSIKSKLETLAYIVGGLLIFLLLSFVEAFERFVEFSRTHERFELDEVALLFAVGGVVLPFALIRRSRQMHRDYKDYLTAQADLRRLVEVDSLTRIGNRAKFKQALLDHVKRSVDASACAHLIKLDLDDFKQVNDLHGLPAGDVLLTRVADRLVSLCNDAEPPFRVGGDEFGILTFGSVGDARELANRLLTRMRDPFEFDTWQAEVTVSIGIGNWEPDAKPAALLSHADQAMFWAKEKGRNQVVEYVRSIGDETRNAARFRADITQAVEEDSIDIHFQPIVNLASGRLLGFEALARWYHPQRGFVPPDHFIPAAEDLDLIDRLSDQLFQKCCTYMQDWPLHLCLSFNLSPYQLNSIDRPNRAPLTSRIAQILDATGIEPSRIELEITENAFINDIAGARVIVNALKKQGIRLSLDDFGTGTSSLAILAQLPFDTIKIDRSFVSGILTRPHSSQIVEAVLGLAQSMQMSVTAEGIESSEELSFLQDHNCPKGQGYLLGRPVPHDKVAEIIGWDGAFWDADGKDHQQKAS